MLEILSKQVNVLEVGNPLSIITSPTRSNCVCELVGDEVLIMGGQAGNPTPYPGNGYKVNLNTGATTSISGYDGTWTSGTAIGSNVWIAQGHDGNFNAYLKSRAATAFGASANYASGKPARISPTIDAYNSTKIFWGLGRGTVSALSDCYMFDVNTKAFATLASCPVAPNSYTSGRFGSDGKLYAVDGSYSPDNRLLCYDPVANSWSRIKNSIPSYFNIGIEALRMSAIRAVGKYLFFTVVHTWKAVTNRLSLLRYNVETGAFVLIPLNRQGLTAPGMVYHASTKRLAIISGINEPQPGGSTFDNAPRSTSILFYDIDKLTAPA